MIDYTTYTCKYCGGTILGDGYTTALHCENANEEDYYDKEPDAPITLCNLKEIKDKDKEIHGKTMKTYQFIITINEGSDEFWEELNTKHKNGIKEITQDIQCALNEMGYIHNNVKLKKYTKKTYENL